MHHSVVLQAWVKCVYIRAHTYTPLPLFKSVLSCKELLDCRLSFDIGLCISGKKKNIEGNLVCVWNQSMQLFSSLWNNYFWSVNRLYLTSYFTRKRISSACSFYKIIFKKNFTKRWCFPLSVEAQIRSKTVWSEVMWCDKMLIDYDWK